MTKENTNNSEPTKQKPLGDKILSVTIFIVLLPILIVFGLVHLFWTMILYIAIWFTWNLRGRSILFVYSDSPIWKEYLEKEVFPIVENKAIFLDWSERKRWDKSLATMAFRHFGGKRNFNPIAIVFRPFRIQKSFRFYEAFKDFKHGNTRTVEKLTQYLFTYLNTK